MCNAKSELLHVLQGADVVAAFIEYENKAIILKVNHTQEDWETFLNKLNFNYDEDYGRQYLFGDVWLKNGEWLERGEYDGSEWWEHKVTPKIPSDCF